MWKTANLCCPGSLLVPWRRRGWRKEVEKVENQEEKEEKETLTDKLSVTNQVLITTKTMYLRKRAIEELDMQDEIFQYEPTVFVPRLEGVIKNIDIEAILQSSVGRVTTLQASIPLLCIHTDEGLENNTEDLVEELRSRQLEYNINHKDEHYHPEEGEEEEELVQDEVDRKNMLKKQSTKTSPVARLGWFEEEDIGRMTLPPRRHKTNYANLDYGEDDDDDDDSYMGQSLPEGRERRRFTEEDILILEEWFDKNPYPKISDRKELSQILEVKNLFF